MATAAGVWSFSLSGVSAGTRLVQANQDGEEIHRISGLDAGAPLSVSAGSRVSGSISQTISTLGDTTTVTRTA